jgi:hypothetical protein
MILHEFPEGIFTYVLLLRGGFGERRAAWEREADRAVWRGRSRGRGADVANSGQAPG